MAYFSKVYGSWEKIQRGKYEQMLEFILIMGLSRKRVLDVGCGTGSFERFLSSEGIDTSRFVGMDPDKELLEKCSLREKVIEVAEKMSFGEGEFDSIICIDALHLIKNVTRMKNALKIGGYLLVSLFCNKNNVMEKEKFIEKTFHDFNEKGRKVIYGREMEIVFLFRK